MATTTSHGILAEQSYLQPPEQQTDRRRLFEGFLREYEAEGRA